jgi:8-oxo-dGTP pyrophosphatase MutT (NUDIX family)
MTAESEAGAGHLDIPIGAPDRAAPRQPVRNASVLLVVDRSGPAPRVLMGRRHRGLAFMADKVVFPGGRVEPADHRLAVAPPLRPEVETALRQIVPKRAPASLARALVLAAIRETAEETGALLGRRDTAARAVAGPWGGLLAGGLMPAADRVHFIARATTPPGRSRRFDTRFFHADAAELVAGEVNDDAGELQGVAWLTFDEARATDLPGITRVILGVAEARLEQIDDGPLAGPIPFFLTRRGRRERLWIANGT